MADTKGHVKGYIQNTGVDIKKTATGEVMVGPFMGAGQFVVITDYGTGNPYTSSTPLVSGEIGEDLAFYLTESEQTPSAVGLNVLLDDNDKVEVAGGFMLQVLPGASEEEINRYEKRIQEMPAISKLLESDDHVEALLKAIYGEDEYKVLAEEEIGLIVIVHVNVLKLLLSLLQRRTQSHERRGHGAEITCQFCGKTYNFTENDLEGLIND